MALIVFHNFQKSSTKLIRLTIDVGVHLLCLMLFSRDYNRWFFNVVLYIVFIYFSDAVTLILFRFLISFGGLSSNVRFTLRVLTTSSQITWEIVAKILQSSYIVVRHWRLCAGWWSHEEVRSLIGSLHCSIYMNGIWDDSIPGRSSKVLVARNIRIDTNRTLFTGGTNK